MTSLYALLAGLAAFAAIYGLMRVVERWERRNG